MKLEFDRLSPHQQMIQTIHSAAIFSHRCFVSVVSVLVSTSLVGLDIDLVHIAVRSRGFAVQIRESDNCVVRLNNPTVRSFGRNDGLPSV